MTVYAINNQDRTVRIFDSMAEAVQGSSNGERLLYDTDAPARPEAPANRAVTLFERRERPGARQGAAVSPDLFIQEMPVGALIVDGQAVEPEPQPDALAELAAHMTAQIHGIIGSIREASARLADYRKLAEEERAAAGDVDARTVEVQTRYKRLVAEARGRLKSAASNLDAARIRREIADLAIAELEELEPLQRLGRGPGPAVLRCAAAERGLSRLMARLREATAQGVACSQAVGARIAALENADPATLTEHPVSRKARKHKPYQGRTPGESRGRRSAREGKTFRFRADVTRNPAVRGSRRHASYEILLRNPGISYEAFIAKGGNPADLNLALANRTLIMEG